MRVIKAEGHFVSRDGMSVAQRIEGCARLAYKSEHKITEDSAIPFCNKLFKRGHLSVFEFANLHFGLFINRELYENYTLEDRRVFNEFVACINTTKYIECTFSQTDISSEKESYNGYCMVVSGSLRAFYELFKKVYTNPIYLNLRQYFIQTIEEEGIELDLEQTHSFKHAALWEEDSRYGFFLSLHPVFVLKILPDDYKKHLKLLAKATCSRAVSHELVRHRPCSFVQLSQRYVNYKDGQFRGEIDFISPVSINKKAGKNPAEYCEDYATWHALCADAEVAYFHLLETNSPQVARNVLPNSCATEIYIYASISEWEHIFRLRTSKHADPAMRELMTPLEEEFKSITQTVE